MSSSLQIAIDELRNAFPPHPLDPNHAFGDGGTTYLDGDEFKAGVRGKSWDGLDVEFLEFHHDVIPLLPPESFVEYLPAFVTAVLSNSPVLNGLPVFLRWALTRGRDVAWFDARIERLTLDQRRVIARAFAALEAAEDREHMKRDLAEVMDSYWRDLVDKR